VEPLKCLAFLDLHVEIIKGGVESMGWSIPMFKTTQWSPHFTDYLGVWGISVMNSSGKRINNGRAIAYRRACLNAIEYLKKFGYNGPSKAYRLLSFVRRWRVVSANC